MSKKGAAKAVSIAEASFVGKELTGPAASFHEPDLSGHEHADTPLEQLDALLDREFAAAPQDAAAPRDTAEDRPESGEEQAEPDASINAPEATDETAPDGQPEADSVDESAAPEEAAPDPLEARIAAAEERFEARLALERARNERLEGRLAGLQDFVRKNRPGPAQDDGFEPTAEPHADADLRQQVESISARQAESDRQALAMEVVNLFNSELGLDPRAPVDPNLVAKVTEVRQKYAADIELASQSDSPQAARALTLAVVRNITHDVKAALEQNGKAKEAKTRTDIAVKARERKIALAPLAGSGTKAASKPAEFDPWSAEMDDLGARIDKEFGITP